ncbi:MAG: ChaN family lipoprotein, partial [Bdellovibrionales bacterium]|nr:ChaN family lipoprotein [Bdellovibrionales bacterium]
MTLFRHHRHLYRSLLNELSLLERGKSREIVRYERAHKRQLSRNAVPSGWGEVLQAMARAPVILVGDFHTLRQSQKSALKILRLMDHPMALALECVHQKHQAVLDDFVVGKMDLEELRARLDFDRFWPFPWANYCELFDACREGGVPLLALNI